MKTRMNTLEIREPEQTTFGVLHEFYVDGESPAQRLGIADRPRCVEFSVFDLDYIAADKERFPQHDGMRNIRTAAEAFLGKRPLSNQFDCGPDGREPIPVNPLRFDPRHYAGLAGEFTQLSEERV